MKKTKFLSICTLIWLVLFPHGTTAAAVIDDFWPLVTHADSTTWAKVLEVREGMRDRTLRLQVTFATSQQGFYSSGMQILVIEKDGMSPEGLAIQVGDEGLFLLRNIDAESSDFMQADHVLVNHGFLKGPFVEPSRAAINQLLCSESSCADSMQSLLEDSNQGARRLALSYAASFAELPENLTQGLVKQLDKEHEPRLQKQLLELFLEKSASGAQKAATNILKSESSKELQQLSVDYLAKHRRPQDQADLLLSYLKGDTKKKGRLLEACVKLQLPHRSRILEEALLHQDPELSSKALKVLVERPCKDSLTLYEALLQSSNRSIKQSAALGLARIGSREACVLLKQSLTSSQDGQFRNWLRNLMKRPYQVGVAPSQSNARAHSNHNCSEDHSH